jgi:hypothetical protein
MIGTEIEGHARPPIFAAVMFAFAIGCELFGVALKNGHWAIAGLLPFTIAAVLWLTKERSFAGKLTPQGLLILPGSAVIAYDRMRSIWPADAREAARSNGQSYAFHLQHDGDVLYVPARLNVATGELVDFLKTKIPTVQSVPANSAVAQYMKRQVETFGADHVWTFGARRQLGFDRGRSQYRTVFVMLGLAVVGLIWCIIGASLKHGEWGTIGGVAIFFGLFLALIFYALAKNRVPRIKNWQSASLVVCPVGIALAQGDLCGELRWKEIRNVRLKYGSGFLASDAATWGRGIVVSVDGADLMVADLYDAPIQTIYDRIAELWRHGD